MGGRGSSDTKWARDLRAMARRGEMPKSIVGSQERVAPVFELIDRLYPMPDTKGLKIEDLGNSWYVNDTEKARVRRLGIPQNATDSERRGRLKFLLYGMGRKH